MNAYPAALRPALRAFAVALVLAPGARAASYTENVAAGLKNIQSGRPAVRFSAAQR